MKRLLLGLNLLCPHVAKRRINRAKQSKYVLAERSGIINYDPTKAVFLCGNHDKWGLIDNRLSSSLPSGGLGWVANMPPFAFQKAVNRTLICHLLQGKRWLFITSLIIRRLQRGVCQMWHVWHDKARWRCFFMCVTVMNVC